MLLGLVIFSGMLSSTYGHGETMCGNVGNPKVCSTGQLTASGEEFHTEKATAAVPFIQGRLKAQGAWFRLASDPIGTGCKYIHINDKMNKRFHGRKYMDLSPAAQSILTGKKASRSWSGRVLLCHL